ncbi:MAG: hypothetical protein HKM89_10785 [Gemmatimonadales bacterium]|nr:hypothetical protein [Gemmatimonadales bacterium]
MTDHDYDIGQHVRFMHPRTKREDTGSIAEIRHNGETYYRVRPDGRKNCVDVAIDAVVGIAEESEPQYEIVEEAVQPVRPDPTPTQIVRVDEALPLAIPDFPTPEAAEKHYTRLVDMQAAQARALSRIMKENPDLAPQISRGKSYPTVEIWNTIASFYHLVPDQDSEPTPIWTEEFPESKGLAFGYRANAFYVDPQGRKLGMATATVDRSEKIQKGGCPECGGTEAVIKGKEQFGGGWLCWDKKGGCGWKGQKRPESVWVLRFDENTPNHAIESFAQTRANSKSGRKLFSRVAVLSGLKATPAEEMGSVPQDDYEPPPQESPPQEQKPQHQPAEAPRPSAENKQSLNMQQKRELAQELGRRLEAYKTVTTHDIRHTDDEGIKWVWLGNGMLDAVGIKLEQGLNDKEENQRRWVRINDLNVEQRQALVALLPEPQPAGDQSDIPF